MTEPAKSGSKLWLWIGLGCLGLVIVGMASCVGCIGCTALFGNNISSSMYDLAAQIDPYVTQEEYDAIQSGMTYEAVTDALLDAGTIDEEAAGGEGRTVYVWTNLDDGTEIRVVFENDKVVEKSHTGTLQTQAERRKHIEEETPEDIETGTEP